MDINLVHQAVPTAMDYIVGVPIALLFLTIAAFLVAFVYAVVTGKI